MGIVAFKKVHLVAHRSVQAELLAELQRLGALDLTASAALPGRAPAGEAERALEGRLRRVEEAARQLARHVPKPSFRERLAAELPRYTERELAALAEGFDLDGFLGELDAIRSRIERLRAEESRLEEERRALEPWRDCDAPLDAVRPTRAVRVATGRVRTADLARFRQVVHEAGGVVHRGGEDDQYRSKAVFFHAADEKTVRDALARTGFQPIELPHLAVTPAERLGRIDAARHDLRGAAHAEEARYAGLAVRHAELLALGDALTARLDALKAERLLGETRETVSIEGWVPARQLELARKAVTGRFSLVSFEAYDPTPADRVPVLLANPAAARPFESVIELYGLPRYGAIDPTPTLGVFFALFFGFCLTDAGYGILVAAGAGAAMLATPPALAGRRRLLALFCLGGLSTILLGAAVGGWFGVTVRYQLLDPFKDLMLFFACALALGAAHLVAGLVLRILHQMRQGQVLAPLLDQGLWITTVVPLLLLLVVKSGRLPAALGPPLSFTALLSALLIVFFHGRGEPVAGGREWPHHLLWAGAAVALALQFLGAARPWSGWAAAAFLIGEVALQRGRVLAALGRVGLGLYSLYGISGYLSDILSYSRLVALGLGTGTVAMVVNTMAGQALGLPFGLGYALAAVILVVGHLFNIAINLLGAFVHSCRLQYVEFFTKFYESGGRAYRPFRLEPRHVTIVGDGRTA